MTSGICRFPMRGKRVLPSGWKKHDSISVRLTTDFDIGTRARVEQRCDPWTPERLN